MTLGTDGFGRSDTRATLRAFLEWMRKQLFEPLNMRFHECAFMNALS